MTVAGRPLPVRRFVPQRRHHRATSAPPCSALMPLLNHTAAPAPAPQATAAVPAKSGNTLVKVLLIFLVVIFIFGAIGVAGIWYVAHRVKQGIHDVGLDDISNASNATRGPALAGIDPCSLLSKADVGQAAKMEIVRAEPAEGSDPGCVYNVQAQISDLVVKHGSLLHKEGTTEAQRQQFESMAKPLFQGMNAEQNGAASKHPGEAPVFVFGVTNGGARAQISLMRMTFGRLEGGMVSIPGLGDDAIDIGGVHDADTQRRQADSHHVPDVPLLDRRRGAARKEDSRRHLVRSR